MNISKVTTLNQTWYNCSRLTTLPKVLDTSSVTNFNAAFWACSLLSSIPTLNSSKGTIFVSTFQICTALTKLPLTSLESAIDCSSMCSGCTKLTTVDTSIFGILNARSSIVLLKVLQYIVTQCQRFSLNLKKIKPVMECSSAHIIRVQHITFLQLVLLLKLHWKPAIGL